jgi:hypothetical protein
MARRRKLNLKVFGSIRPLIVLKKNENRAIATKNRIRGEAGRFLKGTSAIKNVFLIEKVTRNTFKYEQNQKKIT